MSSDTPAARLRAEATIFALQCGLCGLGAMGMVALLGSFAVGVPQGPWSSAGPYGSVTSGEITFLWRGLASVCLVSGVLSGLSLVFPAAASAVTGYLAGPVARRLCRPRAQALVAAACLGLSGLVYAGAFRIGFHGDDFAWLVDSSLSVRNIRHILSLSQSHFFKPITHLYHLANFVLFGREAPFYHVAAVLFHGLNAFLLSRVAGRLTGNASTGFVAAVLFCLYPVSHRSVMWIAGSELLPAVTFILLALDLLLGYLRGGQRSRYVGSVVAFSLALLTKESAVGALPVLLAASALFGAGRRRWAGLAFLVVAVPFLLFELVLQSNSFLVLQGHYRLDPILMLGNLGAYAWSSVIPLGHRIYDGLPLARPLIQGAVMLSLLLLAFKGSWLVRFLVVAYVSFLAPHLPFVVPVQTRYLYLPSAALCILGGLALTHLHQACARAPRGGSAVPTILVVFVAGLGALLVQAGAGRMASQSDAMRRYVEAVKVDGPLVRRIRLGWHPPDSPLTHYHLRCALQAEGVLQTPPNGSEPSR